MLPKKLIRYLLLPAGILLFFACDRRPEYPVAPAIELETITRTKIEDRRNPRDSFYIKLKFKDGDGDLGMDAMDEPMKEFVYDIRNGDTTKFPGPYSPLNCATQLLSGNGTIYGIKRNPNYFNFQVTVFQKLFGSNEFVEYKLPNCGTFNSRFSRFDPDENYRGPLDGSIEFNIQTSLRLSSSASRPTTIYFQFVILDRAFHYSNKVKTPEFILN